MKDKKSSLISTGVFEQTSGKDTISASLFYFCLALSLMWGLGATGYFAQYAISIGYTITNWFQFILIGLVIPIVGIFISVKSDNPLFSFFGYNLIVIPFGFLLGPALQKYSPDVIQQAAYATAGIAGFMGLMGTVFPNFFSKIGGALFMALLGLIVVRVLQIFIPALAGLGFIDYIAAGIFSLYIGYDMYRANTVPKTVDNAIDVSVELYLDIINLFLTLLRIFGRK